MWTYHEAVAYEEFHYEGPMIVEELENGMLTLKTRNRVVVSVPLNCFLSMHRGLANGEISVTVVGDDSLSRAAFLAHNKHVTTDQTSRY